VSVPILLFVNSQVRGGVEEVVLSLAKGLDSRGFETHLAAPAVLLEAWSRELAGSRIRRVPACFSSWRQAAEFKRFGRYLRDNGIRLVNTHLFRSTLFAAPVARLYGVPVVIETTHGPEAWRRGWLKRSCIVDRWVERLVTANIAVSEANRRYLIEQKRYPAEKIHVVPNGRDLGRFARASVREADAFRARFGLEARHRVLLAVGRLEPQKDPVTLLRAFRIVAQRFPEARLLLAGDGSLRPQLEALAQEYELADRIVFAGFQENIVPCYQLAEIVVLSSLYEGMPLVAIEAGAAGRPIVATAVDGTAEVVEQGRTGCLVPAGNAEALAAAVCSLLAEPDRGRQMGEAARERVNRLFSFEQQLDETVRIFTHYLGGSLRRQAA